MKDLKSTDYRLLSELMKNARRSDRTLAKVLRISQPTVTRRRAKLERELIDRYTAIPKWDKLGYTLFAMTFVKIKPVIASKAKYAVVRKKGLEWLMDQPNIVMAGACRGMGVDSFTISFHRTYSDYDEFMRNYRLELGENIDKAESVLVNLCGTELLKPLNFTHLAEAK
jgi:DNA-binding Lrp family transcriptional regulator